MRAEPSALNISWGSPSAVRPRPAQGPEIAAELVDRARTAKSIGLSVRGMEYGSETEEALAELSRLATSLAGFDPERRLVRRRDAIAFWINLYNAMVIHGALSFRVRRSVTEAPRFFRRTAYNVGGRLFSLDVIEHGLLRENRGHPMRMGLPQLMPWDRRRALVIRPLDVRIHFALNCGAVSCPPIRHYTPDNLEEELDLAARSFVGSGGVAVDSDTGGVLLSRIFLWYMRDFGWTRLKQLHAVVGYLDKQQRGVVNEAARNGIRYAKYDWSFA